MRKLRIIVNDIFFIAELLDTPTANKIYEVLPLSGVCNVWGNEIYFNVPLNLELESEAQQEVEVGDMAYWPVGPAVCLFFGTTPVSQGDLPKAYSPVNVFAKIEGDILLLKNVYQGDKIKLEALKE